MLATLSIPTVAASLTLLCPPMGEMPSNAYDSAWRVWTDGPDRPSAPPPPGYDPAIHGQWQPPTEWPVIGIHGVVLKDGRVLHWSYPDGDAGSNARAWDPGTGNFENVTLSTDIFCSGHAVLPDGRVLVIGGNDYECEAQGRRSLRVFDPVTMNWSFIENMFDGRWYPAATTLGDGRVVITSGLAVDCELNGDMEIYEDGVGVAVVEEGHRYLELFPRIHLLSNGRIAHVGPERYTYDFALGKPWDFVAETNYGERWNNTTVLIPGRVDEIMSIGGGDPNVTNTVEIIDFKDANPQWEYTTPMSHARGHHNAVILPDKTVFVIGGGTDGFYGDPGFIPELFDPETDTWLELPPHAYARMYHSTALLVPDGRVIIAGQDFGHSFYWGEIYEPPYLFRGPRPVIGDAPAELVYGQSFTVDTPQAAQIADVALIRLSSNTHSVNFEQRYVGLGFALIEGGASLSVTMEPEPNLAPPGHYMLFILNGNGVPSVATMVDVDLPIAGDINLDGVIDTEDLLALLATWGPCPGCPADLNGDNVIDVQDLLIMFANWS